MMKKTMHPLMKQHTLLVLLTLTLLAGSCGPAGETAPATATPPIEPVLPTETPQPVLPEEQASLIFHNGVILTMESGLQVSAIAIEDDRILDLGSDEEMMAYAGPGTTLVDLGGRTMMPGFVDPHSHNFMSVWGDDPEAGQSYLLSLGFTTVAEMSVDEGVILQIQEMDAQGRLRMRISLYPVHVDVCGNLIGSWYTEAFPVSRERGALVQIPGVKIFTDGGGCNAPAVSYNQEGILDGIGSGDLYFTVEELTQILVEVQGNGYQAAVHGLGDRAIETNLNAIEAALDGGPNSYRHRIEHNALVRDDMLTRYSEVDVVALIFGSFPTHFFGCMGEEPKSSTPEEFSGWEWRWRDLIDANPDVHFAWHADTPPMGDPSPMLNLHGFVTRRQQRDDGSFCEPREWAADDLLTVEEALPLMTIEAAYALLREDEIGSLAPGKLADLIILSENPLEVDPNAILDIQVLMTMVGGQTAHCADGQNALCP
jgi:predicted amidohydrolase YtcJ